MSEEEMILKKIFIDSLLVFCFCLQLFDVIGIINVSDFMLTAICVLIFCFNVKRYYNCKISQKKVTIYEKIHYIFILTLPWIILLFTNIIDEFRLLNSKFILFRVYNTYQLFNILLILGMWYYIRKFYELSERKEEER